MWLMPLPWLFYLQFPKATHPSHSWTHRDPALPMRGILVPFRGLALPFETERHHTGGQQPVEDRLGWIEVGKCGQRIRLSSTGLS